jgi:hypothetical protein
MKNKNFASILGWIGMSLILGAYFLVSYKFVKGDEFSYQIMNLVGSVFLFYNAYYSKSKPLMALQISWAIIAIIAIVKIWI